MSDSSKLRPLASHEPGIELQEEKTTTDAPSATDGVHRRWSAESIVGDDIDTQGAAAVADQPEARLSQAQQQPGVARPTLGIEDRWGFFDTRMDSLRILLQLTFLCDPFLHLQADTNKKLGLGRYFYACSHDLTKTFFEVP